MNAKRWAGNRLVMLSRADSWGVFAFGVTILNMGISSVRAAEPAIAAAPVIELPARALLESMATRYGALHSYADDMTMDFKGVPDFPAEMRDEFKFRAQVAWQKPNKAQIVKYTDNGTAWSTSDGTTLWASTPLHKGFYLKRPANEHSIGDALNEIGVGAPGLGIIEEGQGVAWLERQGLTSLKSGADATMNELPVHQVIAHLEFPDGGSADTTLAIGAQDGLLHRVTQEYTSPRGRMTVVETHTNIRLDPTLPDATFSFTPPAGTLPIQYYAALEGDRFKPKVKEGEPLLPFQAIDLKGQPLSLQDYKGKLLIIHFFATWEATASDVPAMVQLYHRYRDQGVAVIGVALDAKRERVTQLVDQAGVPYPVVFDGQGWNNAVAKLYGVRSLPTTLLVGRDGKLRRVLSRPTGIDFEDAIAAALAPVTP
ncbi:MAG: redoxin domain-containing protein [Abitibacteriaceae bacterium]|nr:redoxin domain-containing protein [Abditibacteriaceae bacterium]